jgi:hypothetical protein
VYADEIVLELRHHIMSDVEKLNTRIDYQFNEALKSPLYRQKREETDPPKPTRGKPKRAR